MKKQPSVSIVIVFKKETPYLLECLKHCLELEYENYDILLFPDKELSNDFTKNLRKHGSKIKIVPTGEVNIPKKRNISIKHVSSEFIAFIDDDAYPKKDWLTNAIPLFSDNIVGGVGGPNLTPSNDPYIQRIAGNVIKSRIAMGAVYINNVSCPEQFVNALPTCNLIFKTSLLKEIGFDENMSTGEDARLCVDIRERGLKILYSPDVEVYHHRRNILIPFIKQLFYYGVYKGKLYRSNKTPYAHFFLPSVFFIFVVLGFVTSLFNKIIAVGYSSSMIVYFSIILVGAIKNSKFLEIVPTWACIFFIQMSYGAGFILGFLFK